MWPRFCARLAAPETTADMYSGPDFRPAGRPRKWGLKNPPGVFFLPPYGRLLRLLEARGGSQAGPRLEASPQEMEPGRPAPHPLKQHCTPASGPVWFSC